MRKLGIYVHVPFCAKKCNYCDFLSFPGTTREAREKYRDAVWNELKWWAKQYGKEKYREEPWSVKEEYEVDTIFVGGGTPSVWEAYSLWRIALVVKELFNCSDKLEFTVEANPGTIDVDKLSVWGVFGVNRLSFGVQSFDEEMLRVMGRIHSAEMAEELYKTARKYFYKNINLDLMFGIPGQTMEQWRDTLEKAIRLDPDHISFYSLQLEEGTPFYEGVQKGELEPVSDETDRAMYHLAVEMLTKAGYHHYEISNAAKPGFESKHNLKYWSMDEYLGVGIGAASYMKSAPAAMIDPVEKGVDARERVEKYGFRFQNTDDFEYYLTGEDPVLPDSLHINTLDEYVSEFFFTGLRKLKGVKLTDLEEVTEKKISELRTPDGEAVRDVISRHVKGGLLTEEDGFIRLTEKGLDVANTVLRDFV